MCIWRVPSFQYDVYHRLLSVDSAVDLCIPSVMGKQAPVTFFHGDAVDSMWFLLIEFLCEPPPHT